MASRSGLLHRVVTLCDSGEPERGLRLLLVAELRRSIPFDAYAWLLTDPVTSVGTAPLADVPCLPELPLLIRLKYLTVVNRWTTIEGARSLHAATSGDMATSLVWRELLRRYDVTDVASIVFRDKFGYWGFLDLWRCAGRFTEPDLRALDEVTDCITARLRREQAGQLADDGRSLVGPLVLMLTRDLVVTSQTPQTHDVLPHLLPPEADRPVVPAGAYNVAAQLLAVEAGVDGHAPSARTFLDDGAAVTLRAAGLEHDRQGASSLIAVTIEQATTSDRVSLLARASGFSDRETQLLRAMVRGGDTRELATELLVSAHTIQDHLKSIFNKTSTHSRRELLARLVGSATSTAP